MAISVKLSLITARSIFLSIILRNVRK